MEFLLDYGYFGIFVAAFLAATVVPFSADILLLTFIAIGGEPVKTVIYATIGNWLGGMSSYYIGRIGKWEWIEKWLRVKKQKIEQQQHIVKLYHVLLALLTWLPIVGDLFAIALGFYKVRVIPVAIFMFLGKALRFVIWAWIYVELKN